jgi:DNA uptake protein ComE-like DNA-binding protein
MRAVYVFPILATVALLVTVPLGLSGQDRACVDINRASVEQLRRIIHIDEVRAREIVTLRRERTFASVDQLNRVRGIGPARIRDIKEQGLACVRTPGGGGT